MVSCFSKKKPRYYQDKGWKSRRPLVDPSPQQLGLPVQGHFTTPYGVAAAPFGYQPAMPTYYLPQAGSNVPGCNAFQQGGTQFLVAPPAMPMLYGTQQPQVPMTYAQIPMACYPMLISGQYPQVPAHSQPCPDPARHNLPPPARKITNGEE